jgi:hypothetical protein
LRRLPADVMAEKMSPVLRIREDTIRSPSQYGGNIV